MDNTENYIDEHNTIDADNFAELAAETLMDRINEMREEKKEKQHEH